jgi:hypothetical protein
MLKIIKNKEEEFLKEQEIIKNITCVKERFKYFKKNGVYYLKKELKKNDMNCGVEVNFINSKCIEIIDFFADYHGSYLVDNNIFLSDKVVNSLSSIEFSLENHPNEKDKIYRDFLNNMMKEFPKNESISNKFPEFLSLLFDEIMKTNLFFYTNLVEAISILDEIDEVEEDE